MNLSMNPSKKPIISTDLTAESLPTNRRTLVNSLWTAKASLSVGKALAAMANLRSMRMGVVDFLEQVV